MKDVILKTKDGKEISFTFLNHSKGFRLGMRAGKEGWGQEGGAWQKNGLAFRTGWWAKQCLRATDTGTTLPYTEKEIRTAIDEDVKSKGDARLDGEPTGIFITFLIGPDARGFGYDNIFAPSATIHFMMDSVEFEREQLKGSNCRLAIIAFEPLFNNRKVNGTPLMLDDFAFFALANMIQWAKKQDEEDDGRRVQGVCQCFFSLMFGERILRKWFADGCPEDGYVKVLEQGNG